MSIHTANFFTNIVGFFIAAAIAIFTYFKWSFQYWERKGVPFLKPSIPFGNLENFFASKRAPGIVTRDAYNELKKMGVKFGGFYALTRPTLIPVDPEIVRSVLAKDFK